MWLDLPNNYFTFLHTTRMKQESENLTVDGKKNESVTQYTVQFIVDGLGFHSLRHFLLYQRAIFFANAGDGKGNYALAEKILIATNLAPFEDRSTVHGFDEGEWEKAELYLVAIGLYSKMAQNIEGKNQLLHTGDMPIAVLPARRGPGATDDEHWTIGISLAELRERAIADWPHRNRLGEALMAVREYTKKGWSAVKDPGTRPANQREALIHCVHYWLRPHNLIVATTMTRTTYYVATFVRFFAETFPLSGFPSVPVGSAVRGLLGGNSSIHTPTPNGKLEIPGQVKDLFVCARQNNLLLTDQS